MHRCTPTKIIKSTPQNTQIYNLSILIVAFRYQDKLSSLMYYAKFQNISIKRFIHQQYDSCSQ